MRLLLLIITCLSFAGTASAPNNGAANATSTRQNQDYALFFAVNNYAEMNNLQNPIQNARDVAAVLKSDYGFNTEVVTNPTYDQIEAKIKAYQADFQRGIKDRKGQLFLFFSGHGLKDYGDGYFIPADGDPGRPHRTALPYGYLRGEIDKIDCQHIMVMVDACHSATFNPAWKNKPNTRYGRPGERYVDQTLQNHTQHRARLFITSDAVGEQTPDRSALTRQLLEGLRQYSSTTNYLTSSILASSYLERANPLPGGGEFGSDRSAGASCFLFFKEGGGGISLEEQRIWSLAVQKDNRNAYLFYQQVYPRGVFAAEATAAIKRLGLMPNGEAPVRVDLEQAIMNSGNIRPANMSDNMLFIKGGTFQMGDQFKEGDYTETPVHDVTLSDFYLSRTELTFAEYDLFCNSTGRELPYDNGWGRIDKPVIYVSWLDAIDYCNWKSQQSGLSLVYQIRDDVVNANWSANGYRLPTEAEWEYAARSGGERHRFGNGRELIRPSEANFDSSEKYTEIYSEGGIPIKRTLSVGSFLPNSLGLLDMSGNVFEWCWDFFGAEYYKKSPSDSPKGASVASERVIRGGSCISLSQYCRAAGRQGIEPPSRYFFVGFRLARNVK